MTTLLAPPPVAPGLIRQRILSSALSLILARGYSTLTMADLATELGMSKKTLYVHFPTKEALASAAIDAFAGEMHGDMESTLSNHMLTFEEKLQGVVGAVVEKLTWLRAELLRDFQRHAPGLYRQIEAIRSEAIPRLFSRLLEEGRMAGAVREDVNLAVAIDYHLHAMQGLLHPDTLARLRLPPSEIGRQALEILFRGMLVAPANSSGKH